MNKTNKAILVILIEIAIILIVMLSMNISISKNKKEIEEMKDVLRTVVYIQDAIGQ